MPTQQEGRTSSIRIGTCIEAYLQLHMLKLMVICFDFVWSCFKLEIISYIVVFSVLLFKSVKYF